MKKNLFIVSFCYHGLLGGDIIADDNAITYKTGKLTIPASVTAINAYAFYDCGNITSVTIPEGVKNIKAGAFENCGNLTNVKIPDSVNSIEDRAFKSCRGLADASGMVIVGGILFGYYALLLQELYEPGIYEAAACAGVLAYLGAADRNIAAVQQDEAVLGIDGAQLFNEGLVSGIPAVVSL